jgi:hypothetical protein
MLQANYRLSLFSIGDKDLFYILHRMSGLTHPSQALLQSKHDHQNSNVFNSTRAIFFFGTPHQGLDDQSLRQMVEGVSHGHSSTWRSFINQLNEGSNLLRTQRDDITYILGPTSDIEIISFYETKATPGLQKASHRTSFLVYIKYMISPTQFIHRFTELRCCHSLVG